MDNKLDYIVPKHKCPGLDRTNGYCDIFKEACPFEMAILCAAYENMLANGPVQLDNVDPSRFNPESNNGS